MITCWFYLYKGRWIETVHGEVMQRTAKPHQMSPIQPVCMLHKLNRCYKLHWKYLHARNSSAQSLTVHVKSKKKQAWSRCSTHLQSPFLLKVKRKSGWATPQPTSTLKATDWTHLRRSSAAARGRKDEEGSLSPQQSSEEQPHVWPERAARHADSTGVPPPTDKQRHFRQSAGRVFPDQSPLLTFPGIATQRRSINTIAFPRGKPVRKNSIARKKTLDCCRELGWKQQWTECLNAWVLNINNVLVHLLW